METEKGYSGAINSDHVHFDFRFLQKQGGVSEVSCSYTVCGGAHLEYLWAETGDLA